MTIKHAEIRWKLDKTGPRYTSWCAVAAFFDGDGGLDVEPRSFTLHWALSFVDNWPPQLLQIKSFLEGQGIQVSTLKHSGHGGWKIQVAAIDSMKKVARLMLETGCLVKKREEIVIMIQYFDGRITGNAVGEYINHEVRIGKRTGKVRRFDVPSTYPDGKIESLRGFSRSRSSLSTRQKAVIANTYSAKGLTMYQLALVYHVSPPTIYRVVRGLRRGSA